jgi:hypothetical protein
MTGRTVGLSPPTRQKPCTEKTSKPASEESGANRATTCWTPTCRCSVAEQSVASRESPVRLLVLDRPAERGAGLAASQSGPSRSPLHASRVISKGLP